MRRHDSGCAQPQLGFLLADADEREREARIRELRLLAYRDLGAGHPVTAAFAAAIDDPLRLTRPWHCSLPRRRLLATYSALT